MSIVRSGEREREGERGWYICQARIRLIACGLEDKAFGADNNCVGIVILSRAGSCQCRYRRSIILRARSCQCKWSAKLLMYSFHIYILMAFFLFFSSSCSFACRANV